MQISKACHLCMTNNKNNRKIILLAFCVHFMYKWKGLKDKNSLRKCLQNVFEMKYIYKSKMSTHTKLYIYMKNTVKYTESISASSFFTCGVSVFKTHYARELLSSTKDDFSCICPCINKCRKLEHMLNSNAITIRLNQTIKGAIFLHQTDLQ